jgi:amino acid transporter, AAT family
VGILVNVGMNRQHSFIGVKNWYIPGAPFVGGFGGFAKVFVTASYACEIHSSRNSCFFTYSRLHLRDGGTESLGITAGETRNPSRNMPRVVKFVFWRYTSPILDVNGSHLFIGIRNRILVFYTLTILLIGLNSTQFHYLKDNHR